MTAVNGTAPQAGHVLTISRNKHLPYIASYHGPWLSLPIDLLHSLLLLNAETALPARAGDNLASPAPPSAGSKNSETAVVQKKKPTDTGGNNNGPAKSPTLPAAPPLDPVIFKSLVAIRKLVDDASELVIKAAGGGASNNPLGISGGHGILGGGGGGGSGQGSRISGLRQHRFRELAVQKLARAYRIDEVATSVLTMQGASALDDVAVKVLKRSPQNLDALYVQFFHEKIPSRMLAASTTTEALDRIINQRPGVAEYHRTRAMIYGFREEFPASLKDFKTAIMIAKKRRRMMPGPDCEKFPGDATHKAHHRLHGGEPSNKWEDLDECSEAQLYFLRGACYHQYAISQLDKAIHEVNKAAAEKPKDGAGQSPIDGAKRGSLAYVSPDVLQAPLESYRPALAPYIAQVASLARKSIRDYEKFLEFFPNPTLAEGGPVIPSGSSKSSQAPNGDADDAEDGPEPMSPATASGLSDMEEFLRNVNLSPLLYGSALKEPSTPLPKEPNLSSASSLATLRSVLKESDLQSAAKNLLSLGSYHPLLVEAWYAIGINFMLVKDWANATAWHARIIKLQDSVDGYPVFLPARSMSQADYVEVITRMKKTVPTTKMLLPADSKAEQSGVKRITSGIKAIDVDDPASPTENNALALTKPSNGSAITKANSSATSEKSSLRQYPLHTKRADNLVIFLQT